jgi:hypothetical protein
VTTQVEPYDAGDPSLAMTVEDVCRLAWDYRTMRTMSARDLVARSGYRERWRSITVAMLEDTLRRHPEWVDAWIQWSEDKRVTSGWSITDCGESGFVVGDDPTKPPVRYADRTLACAVFVRNEVASIADVGPLPEPA